MGIFFYDELYIGFTNPFLPSFWTSVRVVTNTAVFATRARRLRPLAYALKRGVVSIHTYFTSSEYSETLKEYSENLQQLKFSSELQPFDLIEYSSVNICRIFQTNTLSFSSLSLEAGIPDSVKFNTIWFSYRYNYDSFCFHLDETKFQNHNHQIPLLPVGFDNTPVA